MTLARRERGLQGPEDPDAPGRQVGARSSLSAERGLATRLFQEWPFPWGPTQWVVPLCFNQVHPVRCPDPF